MAKNLKNIAGVAAASALIGGVTTMLLTPKSGREMRNSIKGKVRNGKDAVSDKVDSAKEKIGH